MAEALFWNEFGTRFNFIAVDYLIYTREVIGNIRQSYPVGMLIAAVVVGAGVVFLAMRRRLWRAACADGGSFGHRAIATAAVLLLPFISFFVVSDAPRTLLKSGSARELGANGYYEFGRAFLANDLDFRTFYHTMSEREALGELQAEFMREGTDIAAKRLAHPLERVITAAGPAKPLNVVLVSIESLGCDYVEFFGGRKGLTPNLDRLAREGLAFTQLYATGLRTVRGLEALSLSIPPTPGHAVLMRKDNTRFQTLGSVFKEQGYNPLYIYGGYSLFDNMRQFFGGNGYTVIDRAAIARENVSHETIWGVADEDLFRQAIREIDARTAAGRKVFAHVMTTTNHRPFTYPAGRIDIPSGSGRDGAVKYTDWAIGEMMREAATRPWFKETLFVFVADHTSNGRGRTDLPPENYRIPLIFYAPGIVAPRIVDWVASQIDVGPTLLAQLQVSYTSRFFGHDILTDGQAHQRAFMANYLTVGYMEGGLVVELAPKHRVRVMDARTGRPVSKDDPKAARLIAEAIAHYQIATIILRGPLPD
ncbi:MAG: LTA synthase family protein [Hyphomicrobiaceae bacterium]|nr:MAG: LTA synthase family protein [Hyphomicrobiaceae bacterium]